MTSARLPPSVATAGVNWRRCVVVLTRNSGLTMRPSFNQRSPALAALADGSFVLVWAADRPDGLNSTIEIVARRFDHNGGSLDNESVVNTSGNPCANPSVAAIPGGGFTVAWTQHEGPNKQDVFARTFNSSAQPITTGFVLNTERRGEQHTPQVAATSGGQLVVWTSLSQDGSREGVYGRWLNDGLIVSPEFRVNTTTHLRQFTPAVATDGGSRALVIWSSYQTAAGFDLFGQRYIAP